ncbi:MAG: mannose-1-phosphate guanylyltransferase [Bacteroidales bacterium]|nr:mannose-1-phosphate guanylyltransferase [Bacteroidales bacterium]
MNDNIYCVIMAGGSGSRLWPLSQVRMPKQFVDLAGLGKTMLQLTYDRFRRICPPDRIVVVTLADYAEIAKSQLPDVPAENFLLEPFKRNTSACIAYAATFIRQKRQDAIMIATPADHLIINDDVFISSVSQACDYAASNEVLLAIGVRAFRPDTGFGYIQVGDEVGNGINAVKTFTEKPNMEMAVTFYECGDFCWNSGVFVWRLSAINAALDEFLPVLSRQFNSLDTIPTSHWTPDAIRSVYEEVENISIDYGIMEKARNVAVCLTDAVWSDLGSWDSIYEQAGKDARGNAIVSGNAMLKDSDGCLIHLESNKTCIVEGLRDYIVAERGSQIIVCPRSSGKNLWQYKSEIKAELD